MIVIYIDNNANAIFIEDNNGAQFLNNLQAVQDNPTDSTLSVFDIARDIEILSDIDYTQFEDKNGVAWGTDGQTTTNNLNAIFQATGGGGGNVPVITSNLTINLAQGQTLNYELTANFGVGYEWDLSTVSDIVNVEGNVRKLIGGSALVSGTYNIPVKAINYYGEDSETIVLTVSNPPFSNSKSIQFKKKDYLSGSETEINSIFGRASNGDGKAWTISTWFKAGGHNNSVQTLVFAGGNSALNDPFVLLYWEGNNPVRQNVSIRYGTSYNYIELSTPLGTVLNDGNWNHLLVTFDGGTTGNSSGSVSDYYSRFKIYLNGVEQTTINSNANYGINSSLEVEVFRVGRWGTGSSWLRDSCKIDELAFWNSDQSSNSSFIYSSGNTHDLSLLASPPSNWWRMGDGDTFPTLVDSIGSTDLTMVNMTVADIVSDVP